MLRGRGLYSHSIDFVLWVWKRRSLSLRLMNGAFLCCTIVACSDNEDGTKGFFRLQSLAFCQQHLHSSVRIEKTTTWLCRRGITWPWLDSARASKHAFKNWIFVKGFEQAQYVLHQRCAWGIKLEYWPPETDKGGPCRFDHRGPASHVGLISFVNSW